MSPSALTLMITPHGTVYNSTPGRLLTGVSPPQWHGSSLQVGARAGSSLCPPTPPPVLRAERMLWKMSPWILRVRDGRLIQMTPLLSDCSCPLWHLVLGDRSAGYWGSFPQKQQPAAGLPQELGNPPLLRYTQSLASAPPTRPSGEEQAGLFSLSLHLNPTPNPTINVCVLRLHFLLWISQAQWRFYKYLSSAHCVLDTGGHVLWINTTQILLSGRYGPWGKTATWAKWM